MNSRDEFSVYGYVRQNFDQKCIIQGIITTIIEFFKNKGGFLYVCGELGIDKFYNQHCMDPMLVKSVSEIIDIATFSDHTMLADYKGRVLAFGEGKYGALGTGNKQNVKVPQQINSKQRAISVCVGDSHSLILAGCGSVLSCGWNNSGQLGHGDTKSQFVPKIIEALKRHKIVQISSGGYHNGALSENGVLFMWGDNEYGQCGVGKNKGWNIMTPTMITLNEKVSVIACGHYHSLLITNKHLLYSFGGGDYYRLGNGTLEKKYVPTLIESLGDVNIINVTGGYHHTLCVDDEFNVWGFGRNCEGQCAQPKNIKHQRNPKQIECFGENKSKAKEVESGAYSSCVITQNNECFVFGDNDNHKIGLKEQKSYFVPTKLPIFVQKASMAINYSTFIGEQQEI